MIPRVRLLRRHLVHSLPISSARRMSSFIIPDLEPECPVHLTKDLSKDQLLSFRAFNDWLNTLKKSLATQANKDHTFHNAPYKLRKIDIQTVDFFGGERIGFIKLKAEVSNDNGEKIPGSVFLRGGSVGMMVISQFLGIMTRSLTCPS